MSDSTAQHSTAQHSTAQHRTGWFWASVNYIFFLHVVAMAALVLMFRPDWLVRLEVLFGIDHASRAYFDRDSYFEQTLLAHRREDASIPADSSIFLGDSVTQGLATAAVATRATNYGIGGEDTMELLIAIPYYRSLQHAQTIFLSIGINDLHYNNPHALEARLQKIVSMLPPHVGLIWSSIMPVHLAGIAPSDTELVNRSIRTLCERRKLCVFIDTTALFTDAHRQQVKDDFLPDGVHLSPTGYRKWIRALQQASSALPRS